MYCATASSLTALRTARFSGQNGAYWKATQQQEPTSIRARSAEARPCKQAEKALQSSQQEAVSSGSNSAVECQLPKLDVAGSIPVSRSIFKPPFL